MWEMSVCGYIEQEILLGIKIAILELSLNSENREIPHKKVKGETK